MRRSARAVLSQAVSIFWRLEDVFGDIFGEFFGGGGSRRRGRGRGEDLRY